MDSSRKEFKALSMAQPIKRQISDTLNKLQAEKRKFLSLDRQQTSLKEQLQRVRRQLNEIKLLQPKTRVKENKNAQTTISINNTDRQYLNTVSKISEIKNKIDQHRRQIEKYKKLLKTVDGQIDYMKIENDQLEKEILKKQQKNQQIKDSLIQYRTLNMRNTDQFKNSFNALNRSAIKEENERKKSQILRKTQNFDELKGSSIMKLSQNEQQQSGIRQSRISANQQIYMTNCIPLVKERIRILIHKNKQKIKISQNYRRFGQQLQSMFNFMRQYKGRDDIQFIAEQFVMKEKQLKKIQQYIGKLENRLSWYKSQIQKIKNADLQLITQLSEQQKQEAKIQEKHYVSLKNQVSQNLQQLKHQQQEYSNWFNQIGDLLAELLPGEIINKGNIDKILGIIEQKLLTNDEGVFSLAKDQKSSNKSPTKVTVPAQPIIDQKDLRSIHSIQLMSYQKLKEYAKDYITMKK